MPASRLFQRGGKADQAKKSNTATDKQSFDQVQLALKRAGLRQKLWPVSVRRLRQNNIPGVEHLRMPVSIWLSSLIINILGIGLPILILQVYDRVIPQQSLGTLVVMVFGFTAMLVFELLLRISRAYVLGWSATQFEIKVSQLAIKKLLDAPLESVSGDKAQTQIDRLSSIFRLADFFGGSNSLLIIDLPFTLVLMATMAMIAGWLVLVPIGVLMIFGVLTLQFGRRLREQYEAREVQDNRTYDFVAECLRGVLTLKGMSMEPFMLRRFERLQKSRALTNYKTIRASSEAQSISAILGNVTIISTVTVGAIYAVIGDLSIGTLAACTLLAGRIIQPIVRFAGLWSEFQKLELALYEAASLFKLPELPKESVVDGYEGSPELLVQKLFIKRKDELEFGPINLTVREGECLGITGADTRAKTAFLQVISGLANASSGRVTYNGIDVVAYKNGNPQSVVLVGPGSQVFDGSILDNLTLFGTGPAVDEVRWAAQMTGVDYDINCLSRGYDTMVGDGAAEKLPEGLVRRLILTRAIAMMPRVLILDEPQQSLDSAADKNLLNCLNALKHNITIIYSTMRPSYFQLADRILTFDDNRVIEGLIDRTVAGGALKQTSAGGVR
ncbi:MAG: Fe3+/spermidine/putrescine ABC transporter ATP-binding protein [Rhodomicrobium sp.]|nr:MAG: Fe3+/spermidine/putrescine ABC transporter ATP-binding protein [Rhodomicrobium sp.]